MHEFLADGRAARSLAGFSQYRERGRCPAAAVHPGGTDRLGIRGWGGDRDLALELGWGVGGSAAAISIRQGALGANYTLVSAGINPLSTYSAR